MATPEPRDNAIRDAKRYIREVVRNDWTFEPGSVLPHPPPPSTACPDSEVSEWRLREYGSSGSELEPEPDPEPYPASPTAVQDDDDDDEMGIGADRRRKRRRQMEEEMKWNEGLRTWMVRRDAWSGAKSRKGARGKENVKGKEKDVVPAAAASPSSGTPAVAVATPVAGSGEEGASGENGKRAATSTSAVVSDSSSRGAEDEAIATRAEASLTIADKEGSRQQPQPTPQDKECDHSTADAEEKRKESTETAITEPDHHDDAKSPLSPTEETAAESTSGAESEPEEPRIPVVPSLIAATNPIRASITPAMYPSIYSKVVVQGLTPTVPINLADVTKAMVQGWKSDGQWPAKPANTNLVLQDDATVPKKGNGAADGAAAAGTEPKRRRSSGVANAVRKVFHFSGHPFHRRGTSNDQHQDGHVAESGR